MKALDLYLAASLMLALLPSSFPVAFILSAVIVDDSGRATGSRPFTLTLFYVMGTATIYTRFGFGAVRRECTSVPFHGSPLWLIFFALLLVAFAVQLMASNLVQLPTRWQRTLATTPLLQVRTVKHATVAALGALSALAVTSGVTTCLTSRLASQAAADGAAAVLATLFSVNIGLGLPLLVLGTGIAILLRQAGEWREAVKVYFAIEVLATALLIVWPSLDRALRIILGSLWLLIISAELGLFSSRGIPGTIWRKPGRGIASAAAVWTTLLLAVTVSRPVDPLQLRRHLSTWDQNSVASSDICLSNAWIRPAPVPPIGPRLGRRNEARLVDLPLNH